MRGKPTSQRETRMKIKVPSQKRRRGRKSKTESRKAFYQFDVGPSAFGLRLNNLSGFGFLSDFGVRFSSFQRHSAFTLPEFMVTLAVMMIVMAGVMATHLFGMKMYELTRSKLGASDEARAALGKLVSEIRSAKLLRIGDGSLSRFTEAGLNSLQIGNALQIHPSTNTNTFVRYFWDSSDKKLKRTTNGLNVVSIVANSVSNELVFSAEDFGGSILTNKENNRVIGLTLQFYQLQYPTVSIGPGGYYDYYQLRTKITRRALE